MTRTIDQMISSEVLCCMSSLVASLSAPYGDSGLPADLNQVCEQAFELAAPIDDWEEAAIQAGWAEINGTWERPARDDEDTVERTLRRDTAQEACELDDLEPYQSEVYEHWAVTDWFADKLEAAGEKVDRDFAGLCVWARTTTGQSMTMDGVIQRIYAQTHTGLEG